MAKDKNINVTISWLLFFLILVLGYLISVFEELNFVFLAVQVIVLALVVRYQGYFVRVQRSLFRVFIGTIFIFSGFVKGVDPVGTQYRIEDYFIAFGTDWALPLALPLSVVLNSFEFVLGVMLLFKINMKLTSWLIMLMMGYFTLITLNDAINNPVPDCGCFGDALVISNWQTLYKNLVIDAALIVVFMGRNKTIRLFSPAQGFTVFLLTLIGFVWFQFYNIRHLPFIDFRNWKVGKHLVDENPKPVKYYLTYKNKKTGEEKEYISPDYPYDDTAWVANWEFISQRVEDPNLPLHDLSLEDMDGNNHTADIVGNPGFQFLVVSYNLGKANKDKLGMIRILLDSCRAQGFDICMITASLPDSVRTFKEKFDLDVDFYLADDITLMSMIRSNPGLILLKDGVVRGKWHYNDFPDFAGIKQRFPEIGQ